MTAICSKFELTTPIKNPNKANVKETSINKNIIKKGYLTVTSTKKQQLSRLQHQQLMFLLLQLQQKQEQFQVLKEEMLKFINSSIKFWKKNTKRGVTNRLS